MPVSRPAECSGLTGSGHKARRKRSDPGRIPALSEKVSGLLVHRRYKEAAEYCGMILAIDPNNAEALEGREFALMRDRRYGEMISLCGRILEDRPDNVDALSDMGLALIMTERILEGDEALDRALVRDPGHVPTMWRKALARSRLKEHKPAISWLDRALAIRPDSSLAHKRKGDALSNLGRYGEAISCYDKSLSIRPDSPSTLKGKARALHKLGKSDESLACYRNAWEADPGDWGAFSKFVRLLLETKRYEEVILYCNRVLNVEPNNTDMLLMKSAALSKLGRREIVDYRDIILEVAPWRMDTLWEGGAGSQLSGYGDVSDYCDAILKDEPWNINVLWKKGVALSRLKATSEAASVGRTNSRPGAVPAEGDAPGPEANPGRRNTRPVLMLDTNILYACCAPGMNHKKSFDLWKGYLRDHVCYVEYTVLAEMRKLLQGAPGRNMWERMQAEMVRSFGPNASDFFRLVSRYSEIREDQLLAVRRFYADMLDHPGMRDTIARWSVTKKDNPVVKERGARALLKNYPDNNILAFAAFCAKETGALTTLLTRDSDFLYFAEQIRSRFGVRVAGTRDALAGHGSHPRDAAPRRTRDSPAHTRRHGRSRGPKRNRADRSR